MRRILSWTHAARVLVCLAFPAAVVAQVFETEPNNSLPQADARPQFAGSVVISGDLPVGDVDLFRLNLSGTTVLRLESFDYGGIECAGGLATTVRLRNSGNVALYSDSGGGIEACGALVVAVPAGSYYVSIEEDGLDDAVGGYKLQVQVQTPAGFESEPNNAWTAANALPGSAVFIRGGIPARADIDFFAVTVPNGASIRAELIEGDVANSCDADTLDSRLELYDGSGSLVTADDDSGRGLCSLIDGTGVAAPANAAAHNVAGGTYHLAVVSPTDALDHRATFNYRLAVSVVSLPADLTIAIQDTPDPVPGTEPVTYTIDVFNNGPGAANNVELVDVVPAGMLFSSVRDDSGFWSCSEVSSVVTCTAASIGPGAAAPPLEIVLLAPPAAGTVSNEVSVTSGEEGSGTGGDNVAVAQTTVTAPVADVSITKDDWGADPRWYERLDYSIEVVNAGPAAAYGAVVRDVIPPEFTYASWSCVGFDATCPANGSGNIHATVALQPGGAVVFRLHAWVGAGWTEPITNVATVDAAAGYVDPDLTNNRSETHTPISDVVFAEGFEEGPAEAQLVVNEFNANIQRDCDLVELRVVSGGLMNGVVLVERYDVTLAEFDAFGATQLRRNDIILVHLNGLSPTCNPDGAGNETAGPTEFPADRHAGNYDGAYDWYSDVRGLAADDNVLTVTGLEFDTVFAASNPSGAVDEMSEAMAAEWAAEGFWHMVGGGVPPGGFVDDNFCAHAVLDLDATGTTRDGSSIQRTTNTDSNDKNGWTTGAGADSSWGRLNKGQTP